MISKVIRAMSVMLLPWTLAACTFHFGGSSSSKPWQLSEPKSADEAIVFGSFVIQTKDKNELTPDYVRILKKGKVYGGMGLAGIGEKTAVLDTGTFIATVEPGEYSLGGFYVRPPRGFNTRGAWYQVPVREFALKPGEIRYLGSFGVKHTVEPGILGRGEFNIERVDSPSEREQMEWLLRVGTSTAWEPKIRKRLEAGAGKPAGRRSSTATERR